MDKEKARAALVDLIHGLTEAEQSVEELTDSLKDSLQAAYRLRETYLEEK
jgi:hypothetical protein